LTSPGQGSILEVEEFISVCCKWADVLKQALYGAGFLEQDLLGGTEHLRVHLYIAERAHVPMKVYATRS